MGRIYCAEHFAEVHGTSLGWALTSLTLLSLNNTPFVGAPRSRPKRAAHGKAAPIITTTMTDLKQISIEIYRSQAEHRSYGRSAEPRESCWLKSPSQA